MAHIRKDMVRESSDTTGTGNFHTTGAYADHRTFAAVMADADNCYYRAISTTADQFEIGKMTRVDATHYSRDTILDGSNGTSAVNFTSGPLDIALVTPAHLFDILAGLQAAAVASAATTDIWNIDGHSCHITGTVGITSFGIAARAGLLRTVIFDGALTIAAGSNLLLPNGVASLPTDADGRALIYAESTTKAYVLRYTSALQHPNRALIYAAPFDALAYNGMQIDGSGDVSQINGTTQLTLGSDTETYVTDTIQAAYKNSGAVVKARQLAAASFPVAIPGYNNAVELKATTALASLSNGDYAKHFVVYEGYRVARLGWGAAGAQPLSYCFQYYNPSAGSVVIFVKASSSDRSRCFYNEHTVASGLNFVKTDASLAAGAGGYIPGDTSGTWDKTTGIGLRIEVFSAGKAASPVAPGAWGSTNTTATTNSTQNILATNNYAAVVTGFLFLPGVEAPSSARAPFIMRPFDAELLACSRYLHKRLWGRLTAVAMFQSFSSTQAWGKLFDLPVVMRADPTVTCSAAGDFSFYKNANFDITAVDFTGSTKYAIGSEAGWTASSGTFGTSDCIFLYNRTNPTTNWIMADARL